MHEALTARSSKCPSEDGGRSKPLASEAPRAAIPSRDTDTPHALYAPRLLCFMIALHCLPNCRSACLRSWYFWAFRSLSRTSLW